jgi:hypothetical protein
LQTKNFNEAQLFFLFKGDQLDILKTCHNMFFLVNRNFAGCSIMGESLRLKKQTWKRGYQDNLINNNIHFFTVIETNLYLAPLSL